MSDAIRGDRSGPARWAGIAAAGLFVLALAGFGAALEGYRQAEWPVAVLGASGVPRAFAFNVTAYLAPGLLAAAVALRRRARAGATASLAARLGWSLGLLAAIAFAAQGVLPLDPVAPDAGAGRLHGVAWAAWGLAFTAATLLLGLAELGRGRAGAAAGHLLAGALVFACGWWAIDVLSPAVAQRLAFAAWFAWLARVGWTGERAGR